MLPRNQNKSSKVDQNKAIYKNKDSRQSSDNHKGNPILIDKNKFNFIEI